MLSPDRFSWWLPMSWSCVSWQRSWTTSVSAACCNTETNWQRGRNANRNIWGGNRKEKSRRKCSYNRKNSTKSEERRWGKHWPLSYCIHLFNQFCPINWDGCAIFQLFKHFNVMFFCNSLIIFFLSVTVLILIDII